MDASFSQQTEKEKSGSFPASYMGGLISGCMYVTQCVYPGDCSYHATNMIKSVSAC